MMFEVAYRFFVLPRFCAAFQYGFGAARDALKHMPGLVSFGLSPPRGRHDAFTLQLTWEDQAGFERFTRTWVGVWMLNGMGLQREAFNGPIQTGTGGGHFAARVGRHAT